MHPFHKNPRPTVFILAAFLFSGFTRCSTQSSAPLSGVITLSDGWKPKLYLIQPKSFFSIGLRYAGFAVDSSVIATDGKFEFSHIAPSAEGTLYLLCIQTVGSKFSYNLSDDPPMQANYIPVVLRAGRTVVVHASASALAATAKFERPDADNALLAQLRDIRLASYRQHLEGISADHPDEIQLLAAEKAVMEYQKPLIHFADTCSSLFPTLTAIRWVSPSGDYERIPEFLVQICNKWQKVAPGNAWVQELCSKGDPGKLPVLQGATIPNDTLPLAQGGGIPLHSLLGKKLTILDIWASWCMPCRRENKEVLAPLWQEYSGKGLQIVGYSIDADAKPWKAAIAKDGAAWTHASHLSGDATPFLESLRISTIPANYLLDAKGVILAKNLHGEELKAFVEEYLKKD